MPVWAKTIDRYDAYWQHLAIQAATFTSLSGPTGKTPQPHIRKGDEMRKAITDDLARRMQADGKPVVQEVKLSQLKDWFASQKVAGIG